MRHSPTQHVTLGRRPGGHTLIERQIPKDAGEPAEKLPELFDIHVMFFADTSSGVVDALQNAFGLDRPAAEKLVADVPVMVKRAASPEVADSLLDLLNGLGAQVVLMPSTSVPSIVPSDSDAAALAAPAPNKRGSPAMQAAVLGSGDDDEDEWHSGLSSRPPPASVPSVAPMPAPVPRVISTPLPTPMARVNPTPIPAPIPAPVAARVNPTPVPEAKPVGEGYAARFAGDQRSAPLELAQLDPTPRVFPTQRARSDSSETAVPDANEFDFLPPPERTRPPPPGQQPPQAPTRGGSHKSLEQARTPSQKSLEQARTPSQKSLEQARTPSQKKLDLGLGSVPPLPAAPAPQRAAGPPSLPAAKPAGPPPAPVVRARAKPATLGHEKQEKRTQSGSAFQAIVDEPKSDLQVTVPGAGDPYWTAKRRAAQAVAGTPTPATVGVVGAAGRSPLPAADGETRARTSDPSAKAAATGAGGGIKFALLGLVLGAVPLVLGVQFDQSIFTGSANLGWVVLQGLGLFGIGAGIAGMRK